MADRLSAARQRLQEALRTGAATSAFRDAVLALEAQQAREAVRVAEVEVLAQVARDAAIERRSSEIRQAVAARLRIAITPFKEQNHDHFGV